MGVARQSPPSPELKVFSDRFKNAIAFKKIDIADLAKKSEYKPCDISKLLSGMLEPGMKKLVLLANALGCSVDYLLGLTPEAKRASVVIEVDTDAFKPQSSERGQTSGQISGKAGRFASMIPELPGFDIELLTHIASFLIERKKGGLARLMKAVADKPKRKLEESKKTLVGKAPMDVLDSDDDDFDDEDDLWDDDLEDDGGFDDDDFEEERFEDDDFD
jgi:transcriptional regulator with XRE-family HTH domain